MTDHTPLTPTERRIVAEHPEVAIPTIAWLRETDEWNARRLVEFATVANR